MPIRAAHRSTRVRGGNLCDIDVSLANPAKQAAVALALATYINAEIS